jgi:RES domain-containing protein
MIVYRISKTKYANSFNGEGARIYGGRWNPVGIPCIYTSENRALALLEYSVNVSLADIPKSLSMTTFEIPNSSWIDCPEKELPANWRQAPIPAETMHYGGALLTANKHLVLKIPSTLLPKEFNYIINPLHPDLPLIRIIEVEDIIYDMRIKQI